MKVLNMKYLISLTLVLFFWAAISSDLHFPNISPRSYSSDKSNDSSQDNSSNASLPSVSSKASFGFSSSVGQSPRPNLRNHPLNRSIDVRDDEFSYKAVSPPKKQDRLQRSPRVMPGRSVEEKKLSARNNCIDRITQAFERKNLDELIAVSADEKCQKLSELNYLNLQYIYSVRSAAIEIKSAMDLVKDTLELVTFNKDGRNGLERYRSAIDILNRTWDKYRADTNNLRKY